MRPENICYKQFVIYCVYLFINCNYNGNSRHMTSQLEKLSTLVFKMLPSQRKERIKNIFQVNPSVVDSSVIVVVIVVLILFQPL